MTVNFLDRFTDEDKVILSVEGLAERLEPLRWQGNRLVLATGCFDLLHVGHIAYLQRAKALGDVLIVGVRSDAGIRRVKGSERPINSLQDRVRVVAALGGVDYVTAFDEDTACQLICGLRPDLFVKAGDYPPERLAEAPLVEALGGAVQVIPAMRDRSTTRVIECIRGASLRSAAGTGPSFQGR